MTGDVEPLPPQLNLARIRWSWSRIDGAHFPAATTHLPRHRPEFLITQNSVSPVNPHAAVDESLQRFSEDASTYIKAVTDKLI